MSKPVNVLFVADIVGSPGLSLLEMILPDFISKYKADFVVANAENSHEGRGLNQTIVKTLYGLGVHVITGGNHSFDKWKIFSYMKDDTNLLRPMNFPKGVPGYGFGIYEIPGKDLKIGVLNLQGRTFMNPIDDPFSTADWVIDRIKEETKLIMIDFHAEATAEKIALAWELDGKASLLIGTHTHVPTNDARIFPKGMGYITDAGMTGPFDSVIGMEKNGSINRFRKGIPQKYNIANGDNRMCGLFAKLNPDTGKCIHIEPVLYPSFQNSIED